MEDATITRIYFSQQTCREVNHDCVASNLLQRLMWYLTCKSHIQILNFSSNTSLHPPSKISYISEYKQTSINVWGNPELLCLSCQWLNTTINTKSIRNGNISKSWPEYFEEGMQLLFVDSIKHEGLTRFSLWKENWMDFSLLRILFAIVLGCHLFALEKHASVRIHASVHLSGLHSLIPGNCEGNKT